MVVPNFSVVGVDVWLTTEVIFRVGDPGVEEDTVVGGGCGVLSVGIDVVLEDVGTLGGVIVTEVGPVGRIEMVMGGLDIVPLGSRELEFTEGSKLEIGGIVIVG